ncbi:MAG: OmpA family protein [Ignavibacteriaceae bacterium]|nr:OmpA family protein [Ignavibacteria bacterium]NNJ54256.1 OmpA family protein [Ignavibacteriaceae bacterium]NNL22538.1 OmpA family protein [Ignavibacteriaceae bacterium]
MKFIKSAFLFIILFTAINILSPTTFAQFDLDLGKKIEDKVNKEVNEAVDDKIDETSETIKKGGEVEDKNDNTKTPPKETNNEPDTDSDSNTPVLSNSENKEELKLWSKYDFVAGEKVIFEDDLSGEESGEFPSRWDLLSGSAEIASLGGENVIHYINNNSIILPLMDKKDFLPEVFTIEFDLFFEEDATFRSDYYKVRFFEGTSNYAKIDGKSISTLDIKWNEVKMGQFGGKTKSFTEEKKNWQPKWKHIAVSFNKRSLKLYMDEERILNIPNLGFKPKMFSIGAHYDDRFIKMSSIKNIRVNEGGKKLYDRIMEEGKFITRGILFEVNKATINGESMGTINAIVKLMNKHSDLKFIIEGHTDSDGEESFNQKLSEDRAASVKSMLGQLGIDASRLQSKGWGESKPVSENSTPEGKANNRRVEFIKI